MLCIIQARHSSKRLPGKVLKKIYNVNVLERVFNQVKKASLIDNIIVATSNHKSDEKIVKFCKKKNISFFCGTLNNVFKRFYLIIKDQNCSSFVRISADSPFIDPQLINKAINIFSKKKYDIVTNVFPRTYPKGFSVEVIRSDLILNSFSNIKNKMHQEHLTSFFYKNFKKYRIKNFYNKPDQSNLNFSIDDKNDFIRAKKIIKFHKYKNYNLESLLKTYKSLFDEK